LHHRVARVLRFEKAARGAATEGVFKESANRKWLLVSETERLRV
jgi:hypothetical protein